VVCRTASCISLAYEDFASLLIFFPSDLISSIPPLPRTSKMSAKIEKIIVRLQEK
jgi:hypothetical protein